MALLTLAPGRRARAKMGSDVWRGGTGRIQGRDSWGCWDVGRAPGHVQGARCGNQSWKLALQLHLAGIWGVMPLENQQDQGLGEQKGPLLLLRGHSAAKGVTAIPKGWVGQTWGFLWVKHPQCPPSSSSSSSPDSGPAVRVLCNVLDCKNTPKVPKSSTNSLIRRRATLPCSSCHLTQGHG